MHLGLETQMRLEPSIPIRVSNYCRARPQCVGGCRGPWSSVEHGGREEERGKQSR